MPRPQAPTCITDSSDVLSISEITAEVHRSNVLYTATNTTETAIRWLVCRRMIPNTVTCERCNNPARLMSYRKITDGKRWRCSCGFTRTIRANSFFEKSHLTLSIIIQLMYMWVRDYPQNEMLFELQVSNNTVVDWCKFLRDVCEQHLEAHPQQLGGLDDAGCPITVEIDESKYIHWKYHRGEWHEGYWVFGAVERGSGKCCLIEVPDRTRETLWSIITQWILPGTHLIFDGWSSYVCLSNIYTHEVVKRSLNFVDDSIHTQTVDACQGRWMLIKKKLRRQCGTNDDLFISYLHERMWRNKFRDREKLFTNLISCINDCFIV